MNRRQKIIVSVTGIFIVLLILIGLTFAYFLTRITGNGNPTSISVTTANLELIYGDGTTALLTSSTPIEPGKFTSSKDFTVTNNGNALTDYAVTLEDFSITYAADTVIDGQQVKAGTVTKMEYPSDMKMTITCTIESDDSTRNGQACGNIDSTLPTENSILLTNSIEVDDVHKYVLTLTYIDSGIDQSADMNKTIKGKIDIIDPKSTIDLTGTVATYQTGDYVEINSTPIKSEIVDGHYKIIGVEPGEHTLNVKYKDSDGNIQTRGSETLTIKKGDEESVSCNTITFTDASRSATVDVTSSYDITVDETIKGYNPYKEGTLAYSIINNSQNLTEDEKISGFAEYRTLPLTKPAEQTTMLQTNDIMSEEKVKNFIITSENINSNNYFTFGDSLTYYANSQTHKIINKDGSTLETVQLSNGYDKLKGKYISTTSGSSTSTGQNVDAAYAPVYYVVNATSSSIDWIYVSENLLANEYYITYGDSYEFDPYNGTYKLNNVKVVKYNEDYKKLVGKYIVSYNGYYEQAPVKSTDLTQIYQVTENSTETKIAYKTITTKKTFDSYTSLENTLTTTNDDYGTSYYYRGNVINNYLNFAGMCWRIVRIEGDGSVKLILEDQNTTCDNALYTGNWSIGVGELGHNYIETEESEYYAIDYINYEGGMADAFENFQINKLNNVLDKLKLGNWCYDDSMYEDKGGLIQLNDATYVDKVFYYGTYTRLNNKKVASLKCDGTKLNKFRTNNDMYVGTLTADEVVFAGGKFNSINLLYYLINDFSRAEDNDFVRFWTISPFDYNFDGGIGAETVLAVETYDANIGYIEIVVPMNGGAFRPAISLKSNITITNGTGTQSDPYVVD